VSITDPAERISISYAKVHREVERAESPGILTSARSAAPG
jgi:hypothetical protein